MIIHQPNQSTHPTHESRSNTWQEKIMAQPENLKEMVTLIIRKSDFIHANQAYFFPVLCIPVLLHVGWLL